jgi:hypothetical protein
MVLQLIIKEEARQEILDSYLWYEEQRLLLGEEFIEERDAFFKIIMRTSPAL